jgi:hypothetical protein
VEAMERLRLVAMVAAAALAVYWAATFAGVSSSVLSLVFTVTLPLVPPLAWWAAARARPELRRFVLLAAAGITFQGLGSVLWYVAFLRNGSHVPDPPGFWTPFLHVALLLGAAAAWVGVRDAVRPRQSALMLDYSVVFAAGACVAVALLEDQVRTGWSAASLDAAFRPVVNVLLVTLIASAGLGRWQGLPLPVGLLALGQVFSAAGDILFAYNTARGSYVDDRWTNLLWLTGAVIAMVTAASVILRIDRPIRLSRHALPGVSPAVIGFAAAGAWVVASAVMVYGALGEHRAALCAGVAAGLWIGIAGPLRTAGALREAREAYLRLDRAHFSLERASEHASELVDERDETIAQLAQRNVELTAIQTMLGSLFELADERSDGELRSRLHETAEELAAWLPPPEGEP